MLGVYNPHTYSRGRILWKGLKANGIDVDLYLPGMGKYVTMAGRIMRKNYDVILATGKLTLLTAWLLKWWHRKPIVFDTFISDYDTLVFDRKLVGKHSPLAWLVWLGDKFSCVLPTLSFLDTKAHVKFFEEQFGANPKKFRVVPVGADDELFRCKPAPETKTINVQFYGTFIPLQGVDVIVRAAKLLEKQNILFTIVGKGQTYEDVRKLAKELNVSNIQWEGFIDVTHIPNRIAKSHISLGIFGTTDKALRVVPHKAYDAIASCRPLITSDTPAQREVFTNGKTALLVKPGNPKALASAIWKLAHNPALRNRIARNGHALFVKNYSIEQVGKRLLSVLKNVT
jgi:glycosyltransferase involved in cell wall biosynthesis